MLAIICAGIAVVHSCQKDDRGRNKKGEDLIPKTDAEIEQRIKVFKQQCEFLARNPGMKNSSMMVYDDALWLMEASLNYSYAYPRESSLVSRVDSCLLTIPKSGMDSVVFQDVALSYSKLIDSMAQMYNSTLWEDKHVLLTDLSINDLTDPDKLTVKMSVTIGKATGELLPFGNPFNETDYWFWAGAQGKCGPYYPSGYGSDASMQISQYQHWFQPHYPVEPGCHVYYTDIEEIHVKGNDYPNPDDVTPYDNKLDYLLFFNDASFPNYHECLDPYEMWFYLQGLYKIVTDEDKAPSFTNPPFKDFISLNLYTLTFNSTISHQTNIKYGVRHVTNDPLVPMAVNQL